MTIRLASFCRAHPEDADCNTVNQTTIRLQKVRLYHHNESTDAWPRDICPYSTDEVKLQAVVWAKTTSSGSQWKPYADRQFTNDGRYYCLGSARPDFQRPGAQPSLDDWEDQKLDPEKCPEVNAWPGDWPPLEFLWEELDYSASDSDGAATHNRKYTYARNTLEADESGWTLTQTFEPGTWRFCVTVTLGPQRLTDRRGRARSPSRQQQMSSCPPRSANRGLAMHLLVREANVPAARTTDLTELLRWCTALLGVPYEWGGHWFGGKNSSTYVGGQNGYEGYGTDCTGLPSSAAALAGIAWSPWRRSTGTGYRPIPGNTIAITDGAAIDIQPGDLLDRDDHVRLVYEVTGRTATDAMIRYIESAGSAKKVRISNPAQSARGILTGANRFELRRLDTTVI